MLIIRIKTYAKKGWRAAPVKETFLWLFSLPWTAYMKSTNTSTYIRNPLAISILYLVDTKIVSNSTSLLIRQPVWEKVVFEFMTLFVTSRQRITFDSLVPHLLAFPSQTQQWTPLRPLYTQRTCLKPKSSETVAPKQKSKKFTNKAHAPK